MATTENKEVKSRREMMNERLKGRYPDKDFADDEALFGQIYDDYDEYDRNIAGMQEHEKAFSDMFTSDPRSAAFLTNWRNGGDPVVELVRQFGTDIKDAIDDPERLEAIAEANKEYVARVAKAKELEETYQQNVNESLKAIDTYQQEHGISDDDIDRAMALLVQVSNDAVLGKFSPESIAMALKAIHHDSDVDAAAAEAEVRGKNTKIEEKLRKKQKGDGTANLDGTNGTAQPVRNRPSLGALDNFGDNNKTIWERGNEKRRRAD